MQRKYGLILIALGLLMFTVGSVTSFVIVIVDDTAPVWILAGDGLPTVAPRDGESYSSLDKIQAAVQDAESEVVSVTGKVDSTTFPMSLYIGNAHYGTWQANIPSVSHGTHSIRFTATNDVGLAASYVGTFEIYENLDGNWYINNMQITDPSQVLKLNTLTLSFRFERTAGSSPVTCTVAWSGPEDGSATLVETQSGVWTGSRTMGTGGTYTITLTATDGIGTVAMTIFNVGLPGGLEWPALNWLQWGGIAFMVAGGVVFATGKGKVET